MTYCQKDTKKGRKEIASFFICCVNLRYRIMNLQLAAWLLVPFTLAT